MSDVQQAADLGILWVWTWRCSGQDGNMSLEPRGQVQTRERWELHPWATAEALGACTCLGETLKREDKEADKDGLEDSLPASPAAGAGGCPAVLLGPEATAFCGGGRCSG